MLSYEKMRELADQAHRDYDRLVADGTCPPLWSAVFGHLVAKEAQAATLATVTPLVQQMLSALEDAFDDSNHVLAEYKQLYTERYRPQRLHAQEDVVKNCDLAITAARAFLSGATKESIDHGTHEN